VYGRPPEELKVFLSSQMRGGTLARERVVAMDAIDGAAIHRAWAWERDAHAGPYSSAKVCLGHARTSDALVLLIAEDLTPMTKQEYLAAKAAGVPRFILVKDGVVQSAQVVQFIKREQKKAITKSFSNEAELRTEVRAALRRHAVLQHRLGSTGASVA
jgi:hypothetical protein